MSPEVVNGLFGLGGIVLGCGLTYWFGIRAAERRELRFTSGRPTHLSETLKSAAPVVEISVGGVRVNTLYMCETSLLSTGNHAIKDVKLEVKFAGPGEIVGFDCVEIDRSIAGVSIARIDPRTIHVTAPFLNPGEVIPVRVFLSGDPGTITPIFRQADVGFRVSVDGPTKMSSLLAEALLDSMSTNPLFLVYLRLVRPSLLRDLPKHF